jgi:hypothetical protein
MNALEIYVREFTGIVSSLIRGDKGIVKGGFLFVSREVLTEMLNKNAHETVENKLKIWRGVHWIFADEGHLTSRILVGKEHKRMIKISLSAHKALENILDRHIDRPQLTTQSQKIEQPEIIRPPVENTVDRPQSPSVSQQTATSPSPAKKFDFSKYKKS